MVYTWNKEPAKIISYTSPSAKWWETQHGKISKLRRFVKTPTNGDYSVIERENNTKALAGEVRRINTCTHTYFSEVFYDAKRLWSPPKSCPLVSSKADRMLPCETMVMNDTRLIHVHRPYSRPLGPGSYNTDVFGSESMGRGGMEKSNQLPAHRDPSRPSPCFTSVSRAKSKVHGATMNDSFNDTGGPDYIHWHRKGLYQSQTAKEVNPATWGPEPRVLRNPYNSPDRHDDSRIDCRGKHATISAVVNSSNRFQCGSFDSGLPRTVPLPNGRTVRVGNVAKHPMPTPECIVDNYPASHMELDGSMRRTAILVRAQRQETPNATWKAENFSKLFHRMHNSNPKDQIRVQMDLMKAREKHQATLRMQ